MNIIIFCCAGSVPGGGVIFWELGTELPPEGAARSGSPEFRFREVSVTHSHSAPRISMHQTQNLIEGMKKGICSNIGRQPPTGLMSCFLYRSINSAVLIRPFSGIVHRQPLVALVYLLHQRLDCLHASLTTSCWRVAARKRTVLMTMVGRMIRPAVVVRDCGGGPLEGVEERFGDKEETSPSRLPAGGRGSTFSSRSMSLGPA